jgi:CRP-like cAMP-binding protein
MSAPCSTSTSPTSPGRPRLWSDAESRLRARKLAAGATLFAQGQVAPALFGVLAGCIETRFSTSQGQLSVVENVEAGPHLRPGVVRHRPAVHLRGAGAGADAAAGDRAAPPTRG